MRFQIAFVVLAVVALGIVFYTLFGRAMRELQSGNAETGLICLLVSVLGFLSSIVGAYLAISLLIDRAYPL